MSGKIHVFPAWESNPYLNMLYLGARSEGWRVEGSKGVDALAAALPGLTRGDVFHIHWTGPVLSPGSSHSEAAVALDRFAGILDQLTAAGVKVIWTVHNTLAHNAPHPDLEVRLAQLLAARADRIIQLNASTRDAVSDFYDLPIDKIATLPHASYAGIYAEPPTRREARATLRIPQSARVVGFIGQIRGYKGIPTLLQAVERASTQVEELTLVLAGKTTAEDVALIDRALPAGVPIFRHHAFISDADIATWFAACDVMVFPYERVLNSGSVLLSATFGRPCVLPAEPHLVAEFGGQPWVSFYEVGDHQADSLARSIAEAFAHSDELQASAEAFASKYTTRDMAWEYVAIIDELVRASAHEGEIL